MAKAKNRLQALDALRGIAALGVVLFHYLPYYNELYGHSFDTPNVLEFGRYGVHLFFMLSGFVIFMTLERTENARWFGLARAFRLLPALWVGIIITFLTVHALGPDDRTVPLTTAIINFTLLHSYLDHAHVDGAYWSLVIEMTFYVWMAILFYTLKSWQQLRMVLFSWVIVSYAAVINLESLSPTLFFITNDLQLTYIEYGKYRISKNYFNLIIMKTTIGFYWILFCISKVIRLCFNVSTICSIGCGRHSPGCTTPPRSAAVSSSRLGQTCRRSRRTGLAAFVRTARVMVPAGKPTEAMVPRRPMTSHSFRFLW